MTDATTPGRFPSVEWRRVLALLTGLAAERMGYPRRNVWGWASIADINDHLGRRSVISLAYLHDKGLVQRDEAHLPGAGELLLWRVTREGVRIVDPDHPRNSPAMRCPRREPDPTVVLSENHYRAFSVLRTAAEDPRVLPFGPGGAGWMRPQDSRFASADGLRSIAGLGYAERYRQPRKPKIPPTSWYRLTALGRGVREVQFRMHDESRAVIHRMLARVAAGEPAGWNEAHQSVHESVRR